MNTSLLHKTVLVTGAGSGIGRATARLLVAQGATVVATDLKADGLCETAAGLDGVPGRIHTLTHDVTLQADWDRVYGQLREISHGQLHGLVNNAGIMLDGAFDQTPLADLQRQYRINVEGPFMGMQGALPLMRAAIRAQGGTASIVNVSSIYGQIAGPHFAAYSASKGAILMLSKAVAVELAAEGIRVNSVHPGPTLTALGANHKPMLGADGKPLSREQALARWSSRIPMGRLGQADEVASTIAFLLSDASSYTTGAELVLDGAYSAC